ncbi:DEAD/DEAH box helicase [Bariatricus massiliensis]|uniref:DEAD/DEAH box helicase n=1 Tax=Bariatricus massiliensis TaxID=1745713 RepID=A0ABS8DKC2_9FIRM|nr:DEAD/DEAH box helicase [Bariatricus massiliensis]MCB7305748.1 DEAD/DEAH box helicase [Bariatricus massiliensis]MCB7376335.1 DEAD/DEAH box helicase [Bariatricus massiliensis]MCB7388891.1 DEAD/DEAH box helicase [Bariatricus massiliensis]MCB7413064.1 DEAD/DEAH box helicase [Bariatricus massiliensis]MCQ5254991.1 DEAD/DEAH box helicase [Bariatricus massiliensis]
MAIQIQTQFQNYKLSEDILEALRLLGYDRPTRIQQDVIPAMLAGKNIVAKAPTGSGKTAAFAIPICENIVWEENAPQALVLEPTRELAEQVKDEMFRIGRKKRLKVPALFGGFPIDKQIQTLRQKSHIVVGTPGRVADHLRRESLRLDKVVYAVIDEADLMLDMGFADEVNEILALLGEGCKISLFSATLKPEIQELADTYIRDAALIMQEQDESKENAITQRLYEADRDSKYETFCQVLKLENPGSCIIFCGTKEMVNVLFQKLRRDRIFCGMLHGDMEQRERLKTVDAFRRGGFRFLIATDVAARGIDFEGITHVINYDFPTGRETYVHRIGRTGRNGRSGTAVSLVCEEDRRMLRMVESYTEQELPVTVCPDVSPEEEQLFWKTQRKRAAGKPQKGDALNEGILRLSIGGGRKSKLRPGDIVGTICSIEGVAEEDIGIIDIRDSMSYVEIRNNKGTLVLECLQTKPIKGKVRKVRKGRL